jgi:phosphate transport system substrate-binding protein
MSLRQGDWDNALLTETFVVCSKTGPAFDYLIDGYADIVFLMGVSEEQRKAAADKGLELTLTPIGREAFVFFVNTANPVSGISSGDVMGIYSGQITNWREVGGGNYAIRAYQRPSGSGSQTMLEQIMRDVPIAPAPLEDVYNMMYGLVKRVAGYKNYNNSLGYSFAYYLKDMTGEPRIKLLSIDGAAPSRENIAWGAYPFSYDFYAVTARKGGEYLNPARAENIALFLRWITGPQGQYLVEATGYTGVYPQ